MIRNVCGRSRNSCCATAGKLALITLVFLTAASLASGASKNEKDQGTTRIYQHSYDEVFQASQEAIERMGMFLEDKDKEKGTISGDGIFSGPQGQGPSGVKMKFDIRIETVSTKPETRVTVNAKGKAGFGLLDYGKQFAQNYFVELQKVLATYH